MSRALLVIDMQQVFADPASPWSTPGFAAVLPRVRELTDAFAGRTVYTRFVAPAEPWGSWVPYYRQWSFALRPPDAQLWTIVPELAVGSAPVLDAPTFGKWGPQLQRLLGGAADIVVAGVSTDCCVLSTVLAAADAGAHLMVAADACAGMSENDHRRAVEAMALYAPLVEIVTTAEVLGG
ncbi:cysteine hydrolase [Jatrophihabitans telluris]|uniref:Cysteine hydrolase n=1 Tax=Jatrophihabitans telluris TaxID=2038343 RepID=A0ABY4R1V6_9ACTN|nr:cysteine hydrolase [Jatrophihabitans telluris]UQX89783.1 cysteine hydrolase [Jatrophihabitans telluris]